MKRAEGYFRGHKDYELFYQSWTPAKSLGTLVVTHGLGEHSECYSRLAEGMTHSNWTIHAWDLRGHGRSEGKRGVIHRFSDYSLDLVSFIEHLKLKGPRVLVGHSMGGLVNLKTVIDHGPLGMNALSLSSPLLGISLRVPEVKKRVAQVMAKYFPTYTLYNEISFSDLTHDKNVIEEYSRDQLRHDRSSALLYLQMQETMDFVLNNISKVQLPVLVQQAGDDRIVDRECTRKMFEHLGSKGKEMIVYEGLRHEIFNELDRARVFGDLTKWLEKWVK